MKKIIFLGALILLFISSAAFAAGAADYYNSGNGMFKKGDYNKALNYYSYAAKLEPRNPSYYRAISACYQKLGNAAMAKKYEAYAQSLSKTGGSPAPSGAAEKFRVSAFGGFTTVAMPMVNAELAVDATHGAVFGATTKISDMGSAFLIGAQGGYMVYNGLYVGPRFEFIGASTGKYTETSGSATGTIEYGGSIFDLLAGASYYFPIHGIPLVLSGDLYFGFGAAGASYKITSPTYNFNADYGGGAFVTDFAVNGNYMISSSMSAGLMLGYRLANAGQMAANSDYKINGFAYVKKGDPVRGYYTNTALPFDFSGVIISLKFNYAF